MDKTNLSQRKWIYNIYIGEDEQLHTERFPVIYMNTDWVYIKRPGTSSLTSLRCYEVRNEPDPTQRITRYKYPYGQWFWEVSKELEKELLTQAKNLKAALREDEIRKLEMQLQRYEAQIAVLQKKLKILNEM